MPLPPGTAKRSTIGDALAEARGHCFGVALISAVVNILMFAGPLYMLQVYDRVMASRSLPTLVALTTLLVMAFGFQAFLDLMRGRIVVRVARLLDERLSAVVYGATIRASMLGKASSESTQPTRDLDSIRAFLSG